MTDKSVLLKEVYAKIYETSVVLASETNTEGLTKELLLKPGWNERFWVVWKENETQMTQKFTAVIPAVDHFLTVPPR